MAQGKKYQVNETDKKKVEELTAVGVSQEQIAEILNISADTLYKYYKTELNTAVSIANSKIAGKLYAKAMKGDNACMIFWLKTRARWTETQHVINDNKNYVISDEPLTVEKFNAKYNINSLATTAETENSN